MADEMFAAMPGFAPARLPGIASSSSSDGGDDRDGGSTSSDGEDDGAASGGPIDFASIRARAAIELQRPASANQRARKLGLANLPTVVSSGVQEGVSTFQPSTSALSGSHSQENSPPRAPPEPEPARAAPALRLPRLSSASPPPAPDEPEPEPAPAPAPTSSLPSWLTGVKATINSFKAERTIQDEGFAKIQTSLVKESAGNPP